MVDAWIYLRDRSFFQAWKDWEVRLGTNGDRFFPFLPKILDWEALLGTLGDALGSNASTSHKHASIDVESIWQDISLAIP